MNKFLSFLFILIFSVSIVAQTSSLSVVVKEQHETVVYTITTQNARKLYDSLMQASSVRKLTVEEQSWLSALTYSLGTSSTSFVDCRELSNSERARVNMGSRLAASKCM